MRFRHRPIVRLLACTALLSIPLIALPARAAGGGQDAAAPARIDGDDGEVIVTARKRQESILSVPVAITALNAEALEARGIVDYATLSDFTPALKFGKQTTNRNDRYNQVLVVRGMQPGADAPSRQSTTVFIDGSPVGNGSISGLTDIERVEVVAGPQSAFYGRSTFSGAVNIITRAPGFALKSSIEGSYASYDTRELKAAVEGPVIPDILAVRISGRYYATDGEYENSGYSGRLGGQETRSLTGALLFQPTSTTRIRAQATIWRDNDGPPAAGQLYSADYNCRTPTAGVASNYICGKISSVPGNRMTQQIGVPQSILARLRTSATVVDTHGLDHFGLLRHASEEHGSISQDLPGGYTLEANASHVQNNLTFITDTGLRDGRSTPNPSFGTVAGVLPYFSRTSIGQSRFTDTSGEIRVLSPQERAFSWLLGFSAYRQRETRITNAFGNAGFATPVPLIRDGNDTYGVFGSINYRFMPALSLSLEGRWQADRITQLSPNQNLYLENTFRSFSPRAILSYHPTSDIEFYSSYAQGNRPGEFNSSLYALPTSAQAQIQAQLNVPIAVPEEKVKMSEVGFKGNLFDRRLRILSAFYYGDWTGRHVSQRLTYFNPAAQPVTVVVGGSRVRLVGVELDMTFRATNNLTFQGTFDYAGTEIRKTIDLASLQLLGTQNPVGNTLPRNPTLSGSFSISYEHAIGDGMQGFVRGDSIYTGKQYDSEANLAWTGAANRFNLRLGIERAPFRIELFGENIFNDKTPSNITRSTDTYTGANTVSLSPPSRATFGIRLAVRD